jgi:aryl-alcohol dehydrogenase-like predicted oxidoreductase
MDYRELGRTGVHISAVSLGTMTFDAAELYPIPPKPETQGRTEAVIGTWLASRKARNKVLIATKAIGRSKMTWLRNDGSPGRQSRVQLTEALHGSLKRLKTDHIDLYQLHWPDRPMRIFEGLDYVHKEGESHAIEVILGVLGEFVEQGKVGFVGLSNETPWGVMTFLKASETLGLPRIVSIQNAFNLVNRSFEIGLAEIFYREQVSLLGYSPLGQGYLAGKYEGGALPEGSRKLLFDRLGRYEIGNGPRAISAYIALARKHGLDPAQMALAFATSRPFVTSTIIGATSLDQLKTDIDGCLLKLSDAVLKDIEELHLTCPNPCP